MAIGLFHETEIHVENIIYSLFQMNENILLHNNWNNWIIITMQLSVEKTFLKSRTQFRCIWSVNGYFNQKHAYKIKSDW